MQIIFKATCILTFFLSSNPNILNISSCLRFKPRAKSLLLKTQVSFFAFSKIRNSQRDLPHTFPLQLGWYFKLSDGMQSTKTVFCYFPKDDTQT